MSILAFGVPAAVSAFSRPSLGHWNGAFLAFVTYYVTLLSSITLYRLSPFHPLAQYPGPLLPKITKLWHVWKIWHGKQHLYIQGLHDKYGDIVRIGKLNPPSRPYYVLVIHNAIALGPNEVSIRGANCITPVLGAQGMPKGPSKYPAIQKCIPLSSLVTPSGQCGTGGISGPRRLL